MKRIIVSLSLVFIAVISNAQGFGLGAKVGANLNKISGQQFNQGYELGYHLGAFAELDLGSKLGLQPELVWNQINTKKATTLSEAGTAWQDNTSSIQLKYLTIPLLLRYKLTNSFIINAGPQFGILLDQSKSTVANGKEAIKSGDLSLSAGVTLNFSSLRIIGRYNIGLQNISDINNTDSWKTQQIQLGVGYKIL